MQLYAAPPRNFSPVVIPSDVPVYRLKGDCYLHDRLVSAGLVIEWDEVPNEEMQPLNAMAKEEYERYLAFLDECGAAKAALDKKSHPSKLKAYKAHADKRKKGGFVLGEEDAPLMGGKTVAKHIKVVGADEIDPLDAIVQELNNPKTINDMVGKKL